MRVRSLVDHINDYGDEPAKAAKDEYDIPDDREAKTLIDAGIVEKVKDKG